MGCNNNKDQSTPNPIILARRFAVFRAARGAAASSAASQPP
jgi:hypothetical protein